MEHNNNQNLTGLYHFQDECIALLKGVTETQKIATYLVDDHAKPMCYRTHQVQVSMHQQYLKNYYKYDPLHPTNFKDSNTAVIKMNDIVAAYDHAEHPYYEGFIRPWGVRDIIELFFHVNGKLVAGAALFVDEKQPDFNNKDIKTINHLQRYIEFSIEQYMSSPVQKDLDKFCSHYGLTSKERDVLSQVTEGLPNKAIASNLCCSVSTIKTHLQHIFSKLQVNSKAEVSNLVFRSNFLK